jgi:hypothetical protein
MGEMRNAYTILSRNILKDETITASRRRSEDNIEAKLTEMGGCEM